MYKTVLIMVAALPLVGQQVDTKLPSYVALGGAYNQPTGFNLWASAIIPVVNSLGIYNVTSVDLFPVKAFVGSQQMYIFQTSLRDGLCKSVFDDGKITLLGCGDGGAGFSQGTISVSGAFTGVVAKHLGKTWGLVFVLRALYMPSISPVDVSKSKGGWNPIAEVGVVWKPGAK